MRFKSKKFCFLLILILLLSLGVFGAVIGNTAIVANADTIALNFSVDESYRTTTYNAKEQPIVLRNTDNPNGQLVCDRQITASMLSITYNGSTNSPKNAGVYTVVIAPKDTTTYSGSLEFTYTINPKTITISDDGVRINDKTYDGTATATVVADSFSYTGVYPSDAVTVNAQATFDNANAAINKPVNIVYVKSNNDNYVLSKSTATATGNVEPLALIPQYEIPSLIDGFKKKYDSSLIDTSVEVPMTNIVLSDKSKIKVYVKMVFAKKDVGINITTTNSLVIKDVETGEIIENNNYILPNINSSGKGTIEAKQLTLDKSKLTVTLSKQYDGTTKAEVELGDAIGGIFEGDDVSILPVGNYDSSSVGGTKNITVEFAFSVVGGIGADNTNYIEPEAVGFTDGSITKRQLSISDQVIETVKEWDNTKVGVIKNEGTLSNVLPSDEGLFSFTTTVIFSSASISSFVDGQYALDKTVTVSYTLTGELGQNYIAPVSYTTNGSITKRTLIIELPDFDANKIYDGTTSTNTLGSINIVNLVSGFENVALIAGDSTYVDANVGIDKNINIDFSFSATSTDSKYYELPKLGDIKGDISPIQLTVSSNANVSTSKYYDGTKNAAITSKGSISGIIAADTASLMWDVTAEYNTESVGTAKHIIITYYLDGDSVGNYLAPESQELINCKILARPIVVIIENDSQLYGDVSDPKVSFKERQSGTLVDLPSGLIAPQYELSYLVNGVYIPEPPQNVGNYKVRVEITSSMYVCEDNSKFYETPFSVSMTTPTVETKSNVYSVDYEKDGFDELKLKEFLTVKPVNVSYTIKYYDADNNAIDYPTDVGSYKYTVNVVGDGESYASFTSEKLDITITAKIATFVLLNTTQSSDNIQPLTVVSTPSDVTHEVLYQVSGSWLTYDQLPIKNGKHSLPANEYNVKVNVTDPNYKGTDGTYSPSYVFTVQAQMIGITIEAVTEGIVNNDGAFTAVYNGSPYVFRGVSLDSAYATTPIEVKYYNLDDSTNALTSAPVNAGKYKIFARFTEGITGSIESFFEIEKAVANIEFSDTTLTFNGDILYLNTNTTPANLTVICQYFIDNINVTHYLNSIEGVIRGVYDAGEYRVEANIDDINYQGTATTTFTVNKADFFIEFANDTTKDFTNKPYDVVSIIKIKDANNNYVSDVTKFNILYSYKANGVQIDYLPVNVGTYTVSAAFKDVNNYNQINSVETTITIRKTSSMALNKIEFIDGLYEFDYDPYTSLQYDANDFLLKNSQNVLIDLFNEMTITYYKSSIAEENIVGYKDNPPIDSGTYIAVFNLSETDNHVAFNFKMTVKINAFQLSVEDENIIIGDTDFSYKDSKDHLITITTVPENLPYTVKYYKDNSQISEADLENVLSVPGSYKAVVTITDTNYVGTASIDFEVKKAVINANDIVLKNGYVTRFVYGNFVEPLFDFYYEDDVLDLEQIIEYKYVDKSGDTVDMTTLPVNAGEYFAIITINDLYYCGQKQIELKINKRPLTVYFDYSNDAYSMTYSGNYPTLKVAFDGFLEGESADTVFKTLPTLDQNSIKDVGHYTITPSDGVQKVDNYTLVKRNLTLSITKAPLKVSLKTNIDYLQGDTANKPKFSSDINLYNITGLLGSDLKKDCFQVFPTVQIIDTVNNISVDYSKIDTCKPGKYTLQLSGGNSKNYEFEFLGEAYLNISTKTISNEFILIMNGNFSSNAEIVFNILDGDDSYKSATSILSKSVGNKSVKGVIELAVKQDGVNAVQKGVVNLRFKLPDDFDINNGVTELYHISGEKATLISYTITDDGFIECSVDNVNCFLVFAEKKDYTILIIIVVGVVVLIIGAGVAYKLVKNHKELPEELLEKGEIVEATPEDNLENDDELTQAIMAAEKGEIVYEDEKDKEEIKFFYDTQAKKKGIVEERILDMKKKELQEKLAKEANANSIDNNNSDSDPDSEESIKADGQEDK